MGPSVIHPVLRGHPAAGAVGWVVMSAVARDRDAQKLVRGWVAEVARRCGVRGGSLCGLVAGAGLVVRVNQAVTEARGLGCNGGRRKCRMPDAGRRRRGCAVARVEDQSPYCEGDERAQSERSGSLPGSGLVAMFGGVLRGGH